MSTILVVDDEQMLCDLLKIELSNFGLTFASRKAEPESLSTIEATDLPSFLNLTTIDAKAFFESIVPVMPGSITSASFSTPKRLRDASALSFFSI